jgi:hypothetical protein
MTALMLNGGSAVPLVKQDILPQRDADARVVYPPDTLRTAILGTPNVNEQKSQQVLRKLPKPDYLGTKAV